MGNLLEDIDGCALIGMVHLQPLPGSPGWSGRVEHVVQAAQRDAEALLEGGCDALCVENMGDVPYLKGAVQPWTVAAMTCATAAVAGLGAPLGAQVLAAANREALAIAVVCGATFIRVEGFAYATVADEGWIDACAGLLLRERAALGADVAIWADVQKKHSAHAVTADLSLEELAHGHRFAGADALVVTGVATGRATSVDDVSAAKAAGLPVVVGSGVTPADAGPLAAQAHGLIVGTALKRGGDWRAAVDVARVEAIRKAM